MENIKGFKSKKTLEEYNSRDFVDLYAYLYFVAYAAQYIPQLPKDAVHMKRTFDLFIIHGLTKFDFKGFLEWAVSEKSRKKRTRMSVGLLPHIAEDYLKERGFENIYDEYAKKEKEAMKKDLKKWIDVERKKLGIK